MRNISHSPVALSVHTSFLDSHMTCKKCKYEFCWVCMGVCVVFPKIDSSPILFIRLGPWSEHGTAWYSCNRYDEKGGIEARDAQSRSRASLERYLHVSSYFSIPSSFRIYQYCSSITIAGPTTNNPPSSLSSFTPKLRRRWRTCKSRLISPGLKCSS